MKLSFTSKKLPLFKWIWYSFLRTALIPLIVVELVFIGIYFFTNKWSQQETIQLLKEETQDEVQQTAKREAVVIDNQISSITNATELYRQQTKQSLNSKVSALPEDIARLKYSKEGSYYSTKDLQDGGPAIFYSGAVPVREKEREKVHRFLTTGPIMKNIYKSQPLAGAIYFNTFDSLNVIYPYFDVLEQYAPHMNIPTYNFYYEADLKHNPEKKVKWTDAYLDPAGKGWMASAIAPVYNGDFLEGVVGIDVTIDTITKEVLNLEIPWGGYGVLVGKDGTILALPKKGEETFGLNELTDHTYEEAIFQDTFKPDQFNIYKRKAFNVITERIKQKKNGLNTIKLDNNNHFISWSTVKDTGWKLLVIVPQENVYGKINKMSDKLFQIGSFMIGGLILFYILFFLILYRQSRKMSLNIAEPLISLNAVVKNIGGGIYYQNKLQFRVIELQETADNLIDMGKELGSTNNNLNKTQMELEKSESDLRALVHSIDDIIIELDKTGVCLNVWTNDEWILAHPINHIIGKKVGDILDKKFEEILTPLVKKVFHSGKKESVEYEVSTEHGNSWFQGRFSPIFDGEGNIKTLSFTARNITNQKNMEQTLIQAKEEAERASTAKSEFLSSMSHELRTPMNAILGFAQLLEMDPSEPLTESQQESVDEILKAGNHLLILINEVLDLAKIESGRLSISIEPVEVYSVMDEVVSIISPLADRRSITLINRFEEGIHVYVDADRIRLKQVLLNLMSNAVKYNKDQGKITFECIKLEDRMQFVITDTGTGIEATDLNLIFEPFYRLNDQHYIVEGTGIGLTVSKKLIEQMNGTIHVESQMGVGSKFWFDLPITDGSDLFMNEVTVVKDPIDEVNFVNKYKILYIEDNPANLQLVEKILISRFENIELLSAPTGELGIDLASVHKPDLILLDINLPGINGFEVFSRLHGLNDTKHIPVIAISANAMKRDVEKGLAVGFEAYLTKPINVNEFVKQIQKTLDVS
ncbi:ATP-binding protein [Cytobacillus sp. Hz8]|uniref:ATP-binding protein n=1 Tax=Cytobacillus sp. Hz8 TaxID=3347168 RepID=UPI0035DBDB34